MRLFILLLLVTGAAYGNGPGQPETQSQTQQSIQDQMQAQDQRQSQDQSQDQGQSQNLEYKRNAPAVTVVGSHSTADMMVCYGLGGSAPDGAATGLWCVLQKDLYAEHRMEFLAQIGLYEAAAKAYCARKLHRQDFDDKAHCEAQMATHLKPTKVKFHVKHMEIDAAKECEGRYGEVVVKEYNDKFGYSVLYDCKERLGKSG